MRKLLVLLGVLLLTSCEKDDVCYCTEKTYDVVEIGDGYTFELEKENVIECTDEIAYWNENNSLVIVKCY